MKAVWKILKEKEKSLLQTFESSYRWSAGELGSRPATAVSTVHLETATPHAEGGATFGLQQRRISEAQATGE